MEGFTGHKKFYKRGPRQGVWVWKVSQCGPGAQPR